VLLLSAAASGQSADAGELRLDGRTFTRVEQQANQFTRSSQDAVAMARTPAGETVVVWQSRRQQEGAYGVYARRYAADGTPLTAEVTLNARSESHQMQPAVALDAQGCAWVAWRSFGQDGAAGSIIARRFAADLATATAEVIVNAEAAGHQTDPAITALAGGGALVVWLSPDANGTLQVHGRLLDGDGAPSGDAFQVDAGKGLGHRTPAVVSDAAGTADVAYARLDAEGIPAGVFLRSIAPGGELGAERRVDVAGGVHAIEPALAAANGDLLYGWLESEKDGYGLRVRHLRRRGEALVAGPVREIEAGEGRVSGIAVALDESGQGLVVWNRHADGPKQDAGLCAQRLGRNAKPVGETFRVTGASEGTQRIAVATTGAKADLLDDGRMAFAWHGDAGLGDESAANLTLLVPEGLELPTAVACTDAPVFEDPGAGIARPTHEPPTFDPDQIDDGSDDVFDPAAGVFDFKAFDNTGWTPPDPEMAASPNYLMGMVNGGIAAWDKAGTKQWEQDINGSGGFWGSVGASNFVFDPEVVWDSHGERWVAFASDANNGYVLAASATSDPNGAWYKYRIDTAPIFGTAFIDSGNLAVDENVITITGDDFSPDRFRMMFIDKSTAYSGSALSYTTSTISGRQSMGTAVNYDSGAQPQYMIWAQEFTTATTLRIYAVTNQLTSPTTQYTTVTVPQYSHPNDPPQQGTSTRPELFEARFWSAMVRNGHMWAVHHQGSSRARARWYEFDLNGWPSGGTPTLVQSGDIDLGSGIFTFFPSIWADDAGNAAITFSRSSSSEYISMQMTYRLAADPLGTMRTPIQVAASTSADNSGRWGDYSATNSDPAMAGSFWGHHEYRLGSWRTRMARLDTCSGSVTNYCVISPNSAGIGAIMNASGSTSIAANDFVLEVDGAPPGQFGLFFYGQGQAQTPVGDGYLCIGSAFVRLPVVTVDGSGHAQYPIDYNNLPPAGQIAPGDIWDWQFWYRDPGFGSAGHNLSDAIEVEFCN